MRRVISVAVLAGMGLLAACADEDGSDGTVPQTMKVKAVEHAPA